MKNLSTRLFSDIAYEKLEELKYEQVLTNPTTKSTFQISITCWNEKQRKAMEMTDEVETKLQEYNFVRTNTSPAIYDQILQKYGITITFEVRYNAIMDCFEQII